MNGYGKNMTVIDLEDLSHTWLVMGQKTLELEDQSDD
jgi:hypothetical protein